MITTANHMHVLKLICKRKKNNEMEAQILCTQDQKTVQTDTYKQFA